MWIDSDAGKTLDQLVEDTWHEMSLDERNFANALAAETGHGTWPGRMAGIRRRACADMWIKK